MEKAFILVIDISFEVIKRDRKRKNPSQSWDSRWVMETSVSNCYATMHSNDVCFLEDFCRSFSPCTIFLNCLPKFLRATSLSLVCLPGEFSPVGVIFRCYSLEDMQIALLHSCFFFLTNWCIETFAQRLKNFATLIILIKSDIWHCINLTMCIIKYLNYNFYINIFNVYIRLIKCFIELYYLF